MNHTTITYSLDSRIATVTLNRPERKNVLDDIVIRELTDVFSVINRTVQARVVVLAGAGDAFCAGMDLAYLERVASLGQEENLDDARNLSRLLHLISSLRKPVIAMVNGPALGGGCGLAAVSDFVFAGKDRARLGAPEVKLGFVPAVILVYLIHRMGHAAAREFVLRGEILDAASACGRGLVTEVVDDADLRRRVYEFGSTLAASTSPSSVALTKDLFVRFQEMQPRDAVEYAATINALARKTDDFKKGIEAFLRKEKPQW